MVWGVATRRTDAMCRSICGFLRVCVCERERESVCVCMCGWITSLSALFCPSSLALPNYLRQCLPVPISLPAFLSKPSLPPSFPPPPSRTPSLLPSFPPSFPPSLPHSLTHLKLSGKRTDEGGFRSSCSTHVVPLGPRMRSRI
jgi:hypothetical protein